jgi:hypothetical protein
MLFVKRSGSGGGPEKSILDGPESTVVVPAEADGVYAGGGSSGILRSSEFLRGSGGGPAGGANVCDMFRVGIGREAGDQCKAMWKGVER